MGKKKLIKYRVKGYGDIEVDEKTKKQLDSTKDQDADVHFDPGAAKIRISILMEGDLLNELKAEAKQSGVPYQTLMKELLRKQLWQKNLGFEPRAESFECVYKGFEPCLKLVK